MTDEQSVRDSLEAAVASAENDVVVSRLQETIEHLDENDYSEALDTLRNVIQGSTGTNSTAASHIRDAYNSLQKVPVGRS